MSFSVIDLSPITDEILPSYVFDGSSKYVLVLKDSFELGFRTESRLRKPFSARILSLTLLVLHFAKLFA